MITCVEKHLDLTPNIPQCAPIKERRIDLKNEEKETNYVISKIEMKGDLFGSGLSVYSGIRVWGKDL